MRDRPAVFWLVAAVVISLIHPFVPGSIWLMVHLVLLGALTHAAMVWSTHFTQTLLKTRDSIDPRNQQNVRLWVLFAGVTLVLVGVPANWWWLTLVGATTISAAVIWHGWAIWRRLKVALPGRFRITIHYYLAAAAAVPVGATFGILLARELGDAWHGRLLVAHSLTMLLGWIGVTVTGTLVTLWPTMLRTRMDDRAEALARQALPMLVASWLVIAVAASFGLRWIALLGLVGYLAGLAWWGRSLWRPARKAGLRSFATMSVAAALCWGVVSLALIAVELITADNWKQFTANYEKVAGLAAAAFGVQLLTGALSYLIPSVLGGGPSVVRAGQAWFDRWATFRVTAINLGVLLWLLPVGAWVKVAVSSAVLLVMVWFVPLMFRGIRAANKAKAQLEAERAEGKTLVAASHPAEPVKDAAWRPNQAIAAIATMAIIVSLGLSVPSAPSGQSSSSSVVATGQTTTVAVHTDGMKFVPNTIEVPVGNRLVIELTNTNEDTHDLSFGDVATPRLASGESATLDVGVIGNDLEGWCTVVGHRQMGMVLNVVAVGATSTSAPSATANSSGEQVDLHQEFSPDFAPMDASLDPAPGGKVHKQTLTVQEVELEVAPGVKQKRWTFNGTVPGPTLRGKIGDVFEITLVNDGTMGHSIDFHASLIAPDDVMRTIAPGESLTYTFRAERAGIWMYHCSTMPMSAHISAGMFGAVIIDPPNLPKVDREYVIIQSEVYLTGDGSTAEQVNVDKAQAIEPDAVTFNGYAFGYKQVPLQAKVGERVRFWVLDAGPNLSSSFHIVGTQFDTVYFEGGYQLKNEVDAFGGAGGGSQVLGLQAAQGGFVEAVFPAPGHYPMVTHVMADAERGAMGVVQVSP